MTQPISPSASREDFKLFRGSTTAFDLGQTSKHKKYKDNDFRKIYGVTYLELFLDKII